MKNHKNIKKGNLFQKGNAYKNYLDNEKTINIYYYYNFLQFMTIIK